MTDIYGYNRTATEQQAPSRDVFGYEGEPRTDVVKRRMTGEEARAAQLARERAEHPMLTGQYGGFMPERVPTPHSARDVKLEPAPKSYFVECTRPDQSVVFQRFIWGAASGHEAIEQAKACAARSLYGPIAGPVEWSAVDGWINECSASPSSAIRHAGGNPAPRLRPPEDDAK